VADAPPSVLRAALRGRCPRCGQGRLFVGVLSIRERCEICGLEFQRLDIGDGAAVPVLLMLGTVIVVLAFWVEFRFSPPLWVHAVLWPVVSVPIAIVMMRPIKAGFAALQYRLRASEMEL
jgi:uncharacterized protein (DUF983 family)